MKEPIEELLKKNDNIVIEEYLEPFVFTSIDYLKSISPVGKKVYFNFGTPRIILETKIKSIFYSEIIEPFDIRYPFKVKITKDDFFINGHKQDPELFKKEFNSKLCSSIYYELEIIPFYISGDCFSATLSNIRNKKYCFFKQSKKKVRGKNALKKILLELISDFSDTLLTKEKLRKLYKKTFPITPKYWKY